MSGILKIVLLVSLAMVFFAPPGEGADDLKCYSCTGYSEEDDCTKGGYNSVNCIKGSVGNSEKPDSCVKTSHTKGDKAVSMSRGCGITKGTTNKANECTPEKEEKGEKVITCYCDKENCNSAQSLNGWPFIQILVFSFGVIILIGFNQ